MPKKGYKQTISHITKARESKLGEKNFFYGKHHSEETRKKISDKNKGNKNCLGRKLSEETKRKIGLGNKGKIHSKEHNEKIGLKSLGHKLSIEVRKKMSESHRGEKCWNWKGGTVLLKEQIRKSFKYRQWRSDVFTRDNYVCQNCFKKGGYLHPHHIKAFSEILEENNIKTLEEALNYEELWNLNNGQTLCIDCHKLTDTYGVKKNK